MGTKDKNYPAQDLPKKDSLEKGSAVKGSTGRLGEEQGSRQQVSSELSQKISAFLDNELEPSDRFSIEDRLRNEAELREEKVKLEWVGNSLRDLVKEQFDSGLEKRSFDVWQAIGAEIVRESRQGHSVVSSPAASPQAGKAVNRNWQHLLSLENIRRFKQSLTARNVLFPAAACACAVWAVALSRPAIAPEKPAITLEKIVSGSERKISEQKVLNSDNLRIASLQSNSSEQPQELVGQETRGKNSLLDSRIGDGAFELAEDSSRQSNSQYSSPVTLVGFGSGSGRVVREPVFPIEGALEVSVTSPGTVARGFSRLVPHEQLLSRLSSENSKSGGYRLGLVDIDWMQSDAPITIVPSRKNSKPPVIWIGRAINPSPEVSDSDSEKVSLSSVGPNG